MNFLHPFMHDGRSKWDKHRPVSGYLYMILWGKELLGLGFKHEQLCKEIIGQ